jgi:hypothetical protein
MVILVRMPVDLSRHPNLNPALQRQLRDNLHHAESQYSRPPLPNHHHK